MLRFVGARQLALTWAVQGLGPVGETVGEARERAVGKEKGV